MSWNSDVAVRTLWQEARGETLAGQQAVAAVIWNRLKDGRWGNTLASVCLWKGQFSGWYVPKDPNFKGACELPDNDPTLAKLSKVLMDAYTSPDPTKGATHYYADYIEAPPWTKGATQTVKIGRHLFFKNVK